MYRQFDHGGSGQRNARLARKRRADPCHHLTLLPHLHSQMTSAPTLRHHEAARPPPMTVMAFASSLAHFSRYIAIQAAAMKRFSPPHPNSQSLSAVPCV